MSNELKWQRQQKPGKMINNLSLTATANNNNKKEGKTDTRSDIEALMKTTTTTTSFTKNNIFRHNRDNGKIRA
jgi:hypothetical protein